MSMLAQNGSITLLTAPPGSGKSLRLVWHIREALRRKDGLVYVCNVEGLSTEGEFEGWHEFEDPRRWMELPPGSTLIVDEAQKFFRSGDRGNLPEYLTAMETIRHDGIRLILATQHPSFVCTHIQKLVTQHEHMLRENGEEGARIFRRTGVMTNVHSVKAMAREDHFKWSYPKELFSAYKSAEVHTVKKTMKSRTKRILVACAIAAVLVGGSCALLYSKVRTPDKAEPAVAASAATVGSARRASFDESEMPKWETPTDYAKAHLARFNSMPWTAPIFDQRPPTADPLLVCASSLAGEGADGEWLEASCSCMTEQGTEYEMTQPECRRIARRGPVYNPYRASRPAEQKPQAAPDERPVPSRPVHVALQAGTNSSASFPENAGYTCETCTGGSLQ